MVNLSLLEIVPFQSIETFPIIIFLVAQYSIVWMGISFVFAKTLVFLYLDPLIAPFLGQIIFMSGDYFYEAFNTNDHILFPKTTFSFAFVYFILYNYILCLLLVPIHFLDNYFSKSIFSFSCSTYSKY